MLKPECWKEVDLYHPNWSPGGLLRIEENFRQATKTSAISSLVPTWTDPLQPLRDLQHIVTCEKAYQIVLSVLYHQTRGTESDPSSALDGPIQPALHFLGLGLDVVEKSNAGRVPD